LELGGVLDGGVESHRSRFGEAVADFSFSDDAAGVAIGAEVGEARGGIGQQVPADDQDRAGNRNEGFEFAAAFDDAPVAFAEGVGLGSGIGRLAERAFEIRVALAGAIQPSTLLEFEIRSALLIIHAMLIGNSYDAVVAVGVLREAGWKWFSDAGGVKFT
jgi:hypothetical protein